MKANRYIHLLLCACVCICTGSIAQGVCSGSALVPVFSETFGTGASSSAKTTIPSGFVTNYAFNGATSLADGQYMVTPLVQNSQKNDWAMGGDHTGNANGNMYLINAGRPASGPVDLFFSKQVDNLCPGSVYSFSAWLLNANTASHTTPICGAGIVLPMVTFNIKNTSGVILQTYTTIGLPLTADRNVAPNWQQYGFQFTLPAGTTSLVLEMRDYYGGQASYCGNDLAIDDILFSACAPTATAAISTASSICSGSSTSIDCSLVNSPYSTPAYQWQKSTNGGSTWSNIGTPGTSASSYDIANAVVADGAAYRVIVGPDVASLSSATCVTASNAVTLTVNPRPSVTISSASPICSGDLLSITSVVTGGTPSFTYSWSGPNAFVSSSANPSVTNAPASAGGAYSLTVTDSKGCSINNTNNVTVNTTPVVAPITGSTGGCVGNMIALANTTAGGVWGSGNTSVATVQPSGNAVITGTGTSLVSYTLTSSGCAASATITVTGANVTLHPDVIECNNGISHFNATDNDYGVTYSNNDAGNSYLWNITGGPVSYQGASSANSQYPNVQLQTGYSYTAIAQFTTRGITCSATQIIHKNVPAADTIVNSHDTTLCHNTGPIHLSGKVSSHTNVFNWTTTGSGTFSDPNALNTTYTLGASDRIGGTVTIYLTVSSTLNVNGNCGSNSAVDSMLLTIYPDNTGINTTQTICSGESLNFIPNATIPGSMFSWTSFVSAGSAAGNITSGTADIVDMLLNLSTVNDAVVEYMITPYAYTPTNNTCMGTPFFLIVTAKPKPAVTITNNTAAICTGTATDLQFSSSIAGSAYAWSSAALTGTVSGNSSNAIATPVSAITDILTNNTAADLTVQYYVTATSAAGCSTTESTNVLVYAMPDVANAGPDQPLCNATGSILAANNPVSGNGNWTMIAGPSAVIFGASSNANSSVSNLVPGTYELCWTISNGSCVVSKDTVTITNAPATVAGNISANTTVCTGINNGTLTLSGYTGTITHWESSIDGGNTWPITLNNTSATYTYNNLTTSTYYRAVVQSGACNSDMAAPAVITVDPATIPGVLSASVSVCAAGNSGTLSLSGHNGNVVRWESSINNGITWSNISNATASYNYTNLTVTTLFRVILQSGNCAAAASNAVTITVIPQTIPGTLTASATICSVGNSGTLTLTGYTNTIVRWESSINNGNTWNNIINTNNSLFYNDLNTTTQYRVSVQSGVCTPQYSNTVTLTVLQPVTVANAGNDQVLCNITSASLTGNNPTAGTGIWTAVAGNPSMVSFTNANDPATTVNGLTTGAYQFVWTISNGLCVDSKDTVSITINPATVPGTLAANATVCVSSNNGALTLTGYTNTIARWESSVDNGNTWSAIANTTNALTYNDLTATTQYRVSVQSGVCSPLYSNTATITVLQPVTVANAGADVAINGIASYRLAANTPVSGTGSWSVIPGAPSALTFANTSDPNTTVSGLNFIAGTPPANGYYRLVWTISNGYCTISSDTMQITVEPPTTPGTIGADAVVCTNSNNGTLVLSGYVGNILQWESSTDNGASWSVITETVGTNQNTYAYHDLVTTTLFRALIKNGTGLPVYSGVAATVTVLPLVTPADAGPDQVICHTSSIVLAANTPTSGTGKWSAVSGNPSVTTFSNIADPKSIVSGLTDGVYQFVWTVSNNLCADSKDTVSITIQETTVAGNISAAATVCITANSGVLNISGFTGNITGTEISTDHGNTWTAIASTAGQASYSYNNLTITSQFRTRVQNGVCPALFTNLVTISVLPEPTVAHAGPDQSLCNVSSATLAANTATSGTGVWTAVSGNPSSVTFTNNNDPSTTINGLTTGVYRFVWTISNTLCNDSKDTVQLTVYPPTVSGTLAQDAIVCISDNKGMIKLSGYTGKITQWEVSISDGAGWNAITGTADSLIYKDLLSTTYYRVSVQNGNCHTLQTNTVTIQVNPVSAGGKLTPLRDTVCAAANTGSLQLAGFTGAVIRWEYSVDNGNSWLHINNTNTVYNYTGLTVAAWYRVLIQSDACSSVYSDTAVILVDAPTITGILADNKIVCAGANDGKISVSGKTGSIMHWEVSTDDGNNWTIIRDTADSIVYKNMITTSRYRALIRNGVCAMLYSNIVTVTVIQPVTIANAGMDQILCNANTDTRLQANTPSSGTGKWSFASGPSAVALPNPSLTDPTVSGLKTGTYFFVWNISNATCPASADTVMVKIDRVISGFTVSSINDCGKTIFNYTNTSESSFGIQNWKWFSNTGDTITTKNNSLAFTTEGAKKITLAVQSATGCTDTISALHNVLVYQFPKVGINAITEICKTQLLQVSPDVNSQDSIAYMLWNLGNGTKAKDALVTVQYLEDGKYTLKLTVATVNSCFDSAYKQITVHPIPDVFISNNPIVCKGDSTMLTASGAKNYIWTDQNNNIICDGCKTTRVKPVYSTQYKVVGYSEYGCSQVKTTEVRVIPALKMLVAQGDSICIGEAKQLSASGAATYSWYPAAGLNNTNSSSPVANPQTTTIYHVVGKDQFNCFVDTAEVKVAVGVPTPLNIGKDTVITAGSVYQFKPLTGSQDIRKWIWKSPVELSCRNCPSPQARISNDVDITLTAVNAYGCVSNDTISIKTFCGAMELFVPNAFSPDGDGVNDVLLIQGKGVKMIKNFKIFSRWGEVVFEKSNFLPGDRSHAWDGKIRGNPASPDVFVYIAEVICEKGLPSSFKGNVAILK